MPPLRLALKSCTVLWTSRLPEVALVESHWRCARRITCCDGTVGSTLHHHTAVALVESHCRCTRRITLPLHSSNHTA
eukprot:3251703-Rhodomonas_salina.2